MGKELFNVNLDINNFNASPEQDELYVFGGSLSIEKFRANSLTAVSIRHDAPFVCNSVIYEELSILNKEYNPNSDITHQNQFAFIPKSSIVSTSAPPKCTSSMSSSEENSSINHKLNQNQLNLIH